MPLTLVSLTVTMKRVMKQHFLLAMSLGVSWNAIAHAQDLGNFRVAELGRCMLENGTAIDPCRMGFRTFGRLNTDGTNVVLFPMWFGGKTSELASKIGAGYLLDSTKYYIIAIDPFGNGSPSNTKTPQGGFPLFTIGDLVRVAYRLLTEELHLSRLHAVVGISMGAMQAFQWAVSYPDFAERIVPIAGSPQVTSYDMLLWETVIRAIDASQECRSCDPVRVFAPLIYLLLQTPEYRVRETPPEQFPSFLKTILDGERQDYRPEDLKSQMRAKLKHDVARPFGGNLEAAAKRVKASMLIVVAAGDHIQRPEPAREFARLTASRLVELQSDCGHLSTDCDAKRLAAEVNIFLGR